MNNLPGDSRVWVYKSSRRLTDRDRTYIDECMAEFMPRWAAHGNQLFGDWIIEKDWFLIIVLDEAKSAASGCSIDHSVGMVKNIGKALNIDFFDRLNVLIESEDGLQEIHFSELSNYPNALLFNPMVQRLDELRSNWQIRVSESGMF